MNQNTSHAVMAQRSEPHDSLDFFPTPPWATRALCEWFNPWDETEKQTCWEPACGEGHMARPLREFFLNVHASDVHDYGGGQERLCDFLIPGTEPPHFAKTPPAWIITNPPFRLAEQFAHRALSLAHIGVAILCRSVFLEGGARYRDLFRDDPPSDVLIFSERVPMLKGRLDRKASSATSYAWFVWQKPCLGAPLLHWIPPGTRKQLERDDDYAEAAP